MNALERRAISKAKELVKALCIDLSDKVILTEVGTELYGLTPILAALTGAKKVYAWTRDSRFGSALDTIERVSGFIDELGFSGDRIEFFNGSFNEDHLKEADVITNSGFLRPLNEYKLKHTKESVVIPLMFEAWELRNEDVDLVYCRKRKIPLSGTWENHPSLMVFEHVGMLALKQSMCAGFEVYRNNILIWSDDDFGLLAEKSFLQVGANSIIRTTHYETLLSEAPNLDFVYFCDFDVAKDVESINSTVVNRLLELNPELGIVHLFGDIDGEKLRDSGVIAYPRRMGQQFIMSETLSEVGVNPFVTLQLAGLKVAQSMIEGKHCEFAQPIV